MNIVLIFSLLSLFLSVGSFFFLENFQFKSLKAVHHRNIYFNSFSSDPRESSVKEYTEKDRSLRKEVQIHFRMKVPAIENHPNVFQTAPGNSGIRMELSAPSTLGLVVGAKNPEGFLGFILSRDLRFNQWIWVKLSITPDHRLTAFVDGKKVVEIGEEDFLYEVSRIAIGTGFDQTRPFRGELADFHLQYKLMEKTWITENMVTGAQLILLTLCLLLSLIVAWRNQNYLLPALILVLALFLLLRFYPEKLQWVSVDTVQYRGLSYSSQLPDPHSVASKVFSGKDHALWREIQLQFRLKAFETGGYPNVFQTAAKNSGIRLELAPPSVMALVIGAKNPQGMRVFSLTRELQTHRWYTVHVSLDRNQHLVVFLDQQKVVDVTDERFGYVISELAVGSGFSRTRPLKGEVADFNLEYRLGKRVPLSPFGEVGLLGVLFILAVRWTQTLITRYWVLGKKEKIFGREEKIRLIGFMILMGFATSVIYHYILAQYLGFGFPWNTFLFSPRDNFNDFFNVYYQMQGRVNNPGWKFLTAPPLGYLVLYPFIFLDPFWAFGLFLSLFILPFLYWNARNLACSNRITHLTNLLIFSFLTYPVLFALDRGNTETLSFLLVFFFFFFYQKQQWVRSVLFLSLAIYLKIMPGVFLALFLGDKRFKEIFYTLALTLLLFVAGIFCFPGPFGDNLKALLTNLKMYQEIYVIGQEGFPFGHSLFGLLKVIYQHLVPVGFEDPMNIQWLSMIYFWAAMIIFALIIFYIVWGKEEFWKKVALLVFSMNLLPHVSGDYKLLYVFIPLYLFLKQNGSEEENIAFSLIFALLLIPKAYYPLGPSGVNISVVLNPLIMLVGMLIILGNGLKARGGKQWSGQGSVSGVGS